MKELENKKVIFFDVGYTLDRPASGDWMLTNHFFEAAGGKLVPYSTEQLGRAVRESFAVISGSHLLTTTDEEVRQMSTLYREISGRLRLGFTEDQIRDIAEDRTYNMENYIAYPDAREELKALSGRYRLGIISDTWPSIRAQLRFLELDSYFSFTTFSCFVGAFKPDPKIFADALNKCGCPPEETVFVDDSPINLKGAVQMGITPVLIAANPASDVETPYRKIRSLSELLE